MSLTKICKTALALSVTIPGSLGAALPGRSLHRDSHFADDFQLTTPADLSQNGAASKVGDVEGPIMGEDLDVPSGLMDLYKRHALDCDCGDHPEPDTTTQDEEVPPAAEEWAEPPAEAPAQEQWTPEVDQGEGSGEVPPESGDTSGSSWDGWTPEPEVPTVQGTVDQGHDDGSWTPESEDTTPTEPQAFDLSQISVAFDCAGCEAGTAPTTPAEPSTNEQNITPEQPAQEWAEPPAEEWSEPPAQQWSETPTEEWAEPPANEWNEQPVVEPEVSQPAPETANTPAVLDSSNIDGEEPPVAAAVVDTEILGNSDEGVDDGSNVGGNGDEDCTETITQTFTEYLFFGLSTTVSGSDAETMSLDEGLSGPLTEQAVAAVTSVSDSPAQLVKEEESSPVMEMSSSAIPSSSMPMSESVSSEPTSPPVFLAVSSSASESPAITEESSSAEPTTAEQDDLVPAGAAEEPDMLSLRFPGEGSSDITWRTIELP